ncbi:threonine synthase [Thermodesulforhabdus norvegica]|uniref:Threonine synthase n=1 Tax=Thermodesulforhabdus norvegica TaxID=39841 RepID=A0A1I4UBD7_9BACT|nr:threonine synthase [Thermodesulforhabdus norvegica]SFM86235.1 L-threonine synthase [Thermodesulforhabdus norvegica]
MRVDRIPQNIRDLIIPKPSGFYQYRCLGCNSVHPIDSLLYVCPECGGVLLIEDREWDRLKKVPGDVWRDVFDYRSMLNETAVRGIYRFHELLGSIIPLKYVVYLGEGHTPVVHANRALCDWAGISFSFKNDGQNPSASFKDRGMASAFSYLNYLTGEKGLKNVIALCASTGDTSASAALYASYFANEVRSAVLLPRGRVTPQQLSQPLGNGATVIELPGVFDDCMKVVEYLSEHYPVALMNSKNAWRILGQESYSFEIAQQFEYDTGNLVVVVPIGNAGNITAVLSGFLKLYDLGIITELPVIAGVQSEHANPVYLYYLESDPRRRVFRPVKVRPSVAQAAMIGNPVSMPRVIELVERYRDTAGRADAFMVVEVSEQEIMDSMLTANRNGHIACTQGGECLAGLKRLVLEGRISKNMHGVLDATAHSLKFSVFQEKYFTDSFEPEYEVVPREELKNAPLTLEPPPDIPSPASNKQLSDEEFRKFVQYAAEEIARILNLQ